MCLVKFSHDESLLTALDSLTFTQHSEDVARAMRLNALLGLGGLGCASENLFLTCFGVATRDTPCVEGAEEREAAGSKAPQAPGIRLSATLPSCKPHFELEIYQPRLGG